MSLLSTCAFATGCADDTDDKAEAATRARQMRDVSRMLDAMETAPEGDADAAAMPLLPLPPVARAAAATSVSTAAGGSASADVVQAEATRGPGGYLAKAWKTALAIAVGVLSIGLVCALFVRRLRRRKASAPAKPAVSIADCFAPADASAAAEATAAAAAAVAPDAAADANADADVDVAFIEAPVEVQPAPELLAADPADASTQADPTPPTLTTTPTAPTVSTTPTTPPVQQPLPPSPLEAPEPPMPDWKYESSAYETPPLQLNLEPVDLLPRTVRVETVSLVSRLHAPELPRVLFLSGDERHPTLRHVGQHADDFNAWEAILRDAYAQDDADGALARWLLPALLCLRAPYLDKAAADGCFAEAIACCEAALASAAPIDQAHWRAQRLRVELARLSRLAGATRLLALRDLGSDAEERSAAPLDAWIDIHIAWAGWLIGGAAQARLGTADALCDRLAAAGDGTRATRRRGDVAMQRAAIARADARLAHLDSALAAYHTAANADGDPSLSLAIAACAHQRAPLLASHGDAGTTTVNDAAVEACSLALAHAFAAGQHPAWRLASLEARLAIQLTHDALPGQHPATDIVATLRRELADTRHSLRSPGSP
ncbi:hypothetical protein KPL74_03960 [Bacillus sp. NP157]|nr:hypothetical protein KPL74_03960 [Bacillus sp. NP157]